MVLENSLSLVKKVNRLLNWGHWFSFFNILLALGVTAVYWLAEPSPLTITGWAYLLLNWIGHTAFLCFMFFILTIFPLSLVFPYQRHIRGLAAVLASSAFVVLIFDAYVYTNLGYHIGSASMDQAIDLLRQQIVTNLRNFVLIVATVGALLLAIQLTVSNFCWRKIERLKHSPVTRSLFGAFIASFMLSHLLHIYADASLQYDVMRQDNVLPLSYPATAKTFLARYELVDLTSRAQTQLDSLNLNDAATNGHALQCSVSRAGEPTVIIISRQASAELAHQLSGAGLKALEQHFAPTETSEALLHLLYGKFSIEPQATSVLASAPGWLSQLNAADFSISHQHDTKVAELPWLTEQPLGHFAIVFDDTPFAHWPSYQQYPNKIVVNLTGQHTQFSLAPAQAWSNWSALRKLQPHQVTQHLDWLPTLLAQAGCNANKLWVGDNLLQPRALPKLTLSGQQIISFKKDKMLILRADGSYGVWSAGTLVPLNDKLDLPMLTDALKRIEQQPQ